MDSEGWSDVDILIMILTIVKTGPGAPDILILLPQIL